MFSQTKAFFKAEIKLCFSLVLLFSAFIFPQQKFRTGVYSNLSPTDSSRQNLKQVNEMGPNTVINQVSYSNRDSLQALFDSVIAINAYKQNDYIYRYSSGYYTKWQAEDSMDINAVTPGIKHQFGTNSGAYWYSGTDSTNIGKLLVTGPDYIQDRRYKFWYNTYPINYVVNFNMKIDGALTPGVPVCEISVKYTTSNGNDTVLNKKILYASDLSNSFKDTSLSYTIPDTIKGKQSGSPVAMIDGIPKYTEAMQQTAVYDSAYGVQFNVKWLGSRNLYVDYIEVYDQDIWGDYLLDPNTAQTRILNYASSAGTNNTEYWYSLDEPQSIDNYEPYKVVDSILTSHGYPPLITAFYPAWNGKRNYEWTIKRFLETVHPKMLMYDYYPYYHDQPGNPYPDEKCLYF